MFRTTDWTPKPTFCFGFYFALLNFVFCCDQVSGSRNYLTAVKRSGYPVGGPMKADATWRWALKLVPKMRKCRVHAMSVARCRRRSTTATTSARRCRRRSLCAADDAPSASQAAAAPRGCGAPCVRLVQTTGPWQRVARASTAGDIRPPLTLYSAFYPHRRVHRHRGSSTAGRGWRRTASNSTATAAKAAGTILSPSSTPPLSLLSL